VADPRRLAGRGPSRALVVGVLVVAIVGTGIGLWATRSSAATGYRTATATTATVRKTLEVSGTASAVHQATADFQVAGTVSAVDVLLNQQVAAGETLASLATTTLAKDVTSAQTTLTAAEDKLSEDESAQSSSSSSATSSSSGKSTTSTTTTTPTTTATTTTTTTTTTMMSTGSTGSVACSTALTQALSAQKQVQSDEKAVAQAETALAKLLSSASSSSASALPSGGSSASGAGSTATTAGSGSSSASGSTASHPSSASTDANSTGGSTPSAGSGSTSTGGAATSLSNTSAASDSAGQLASDQASIDSAKALLIEAQQDLADAQLTSPISGTVVSVGLSVGQSVSAGSTSDVITILNSQSYQATATLTPTEASEVKVGDGAQVTVTGIGGMLTGSVARVGPVDISSSSYTYPLVVALPAGSHGIAAGSSAQITVTLAEVKDAKVVPTSAVHTAGGTSYLEVIRTGQESRDPVQVGVVGADYTQITSKLSAKTEVVLADLSEPVPSSSSSTSTGSFLGGAGGGGFPGGGGFGR